MAGGLMVRQEPKAVIKFQSVDWHSVVTHTALSVITQNTVPRTLQGSKEHTHKYVLFQYENHLENSFLVLHYIK